MWPLICGAARRHFGKHVAVELCGENGAMLWIPAGFGHGFAVLSEMAGFAYKVTDYYSPAGERTILWNDPELGILVAGRGRGCDRVCRKTSRAERLKDAEVFP